MSAWLRGALTGRAKSPAIKGRWRSRRNDGLALEGVRILVVEDYVDFRESLVQSLELDGAHVLTAGGGNSGFAMHLREGSDVILSDLCMAGGTGYDLIRLVRQLGAEEGGLVRAIAMSSAGDADAAIATGFHAFLAKPFAYLDLVDAIARLVRPSETQIH